MLWLNPVVTAVAMSASLVLSGAAEAKHYRGHSPQRLARFASEVHVPQAHGRIAPGGKPITGTPTARPAPEGSVNGPGTVAGSPNTPATCNQQNASSPACYSATQQHV